MKATQIVVTIAILALFIFQEDRIAILQSEVGSLAKDVSDLVSASASNSNSIKELGQASINNSEAIKSTIETISDPRNRLKLIPAPTGLALPAEPIFHKCEFDGTCAQPPVPANSVQKKKK